MTNEQGEGQPRGWTDVPVPDDVQNNAPTACAVTGQTVVTGSYTLFRTTDGGDVVKRYYALDSPAPVAGYAGTVQTKRASLEAIAEDISGVGRAGDLIWSPTWIQTDTGGLLEPLGPVRIKIEPGTPDEVRAQITRGAPTRVKTRAQVEGQGEVVVFVDLDLTPYRE